MRTSGRSFERLASGSISTLTLFCPRGDDIWKSLLERNRQSTRDVFIINDIGGLVLLRSNYSSCCLGYFGLYMSCLLYTSDAADD